MATHAGSPQAKADQNNPKGANPEKTASGSKPNNTGNASGAHGGANEHHVNVAAKKDTKKQ